MRSLKAIITEPGQTSIKILVACVTSLLTARLLWLVHRCAVDLLFWDQWDFWAGLFDKANLWTLWRWQHGPQRQGLGQWIIALIAWASDWNLRAEQLVSTLLAPLAAVVSLATVRSLRGRWSVSDCFIPIAIITVSMLGVATVVPNLSHGLLPLLLVMICAYFVQVNDERTKVLGFALTATLCAQTGFTWIMAVLAVPLLLVFLVGALRARLRATWHAVGVAAVCGSLGLQFYHFPFTPAVTCFRFPDPHPFRYLQFIGVMVLRTTEVIEPWAYPFGLVAALLAVGLALWCGWRTVVTAGKDRRATTVFVLSSFSLAFAANAAVGRVCLGIAAGSAERYVPYMLPLAVAVYLFVALGPRFRRLRQAVLVACFALAAVKETALAGTALREADHYRRIKASFRTCYLGGATMKACLARGLIHPDPEYTHLQEKLDYLRIHRLSLFRGLPK